MNTNEDVAAAKAAGDEYEQKRDHDAEEDEEMAEKEKDLADDAPWKRIQKNTFTRWCNEHLKCANKHIADLDFDFSDGIRLIALLQVLSQKKVPKHNPKPTFRSQKLENVSVAMKFMEDQNIKIVNIDSTDVVDGKRKLILGLIWLLILHYSISMPMWEDEGEFDEDAPRQRPPTAKEKLLGWIQNKVPELPIKNFTKDWNDGRAIGALVDACAPGLCPDWEDWDPKDNLKNAKEAMQLAKDWLDVPQLLEPKDMCNPKVDDLSVMTYLAEFPKCKLKPGAPLRPRSNAKKVRAYGPGLEKGNVISVPTNFTVETFSAGSGKVEVIIKDPKGKLVTNECKYNSDKNKTYTVTYTAKLPGTHTIEVTFKGQQIQKSPFTVEIGDMKGDASKCSAKGPGLEPTGLIVNQPTNFEIFTAGAGAGAPTVTVIDPNGDTTTSSVKVTEKSINVFYCEYLPTVVGSYTIEIKFAGQHIPKSPYKVKISFPFNPQRAFAYGRGIQSKGLRVREECVFYINTKEAGEAQLKVQIIGPGGIDEPCQVKDNGDGTFTCSYRPFKPGRYIINAMYGKKEINKAPFTVNIAPEATGPLALVRAFGPGLEGGVVGKPCKFTVETNGAVGALGFSIEGPSEAKIDCKDNGDGSCEVSYFPTVEGEYAIHITCDEEDIVHSPYIAQIIPDKGGFDASKVKAYGPGLAKDGLELNKRTEFTVDAKAPGCGKAPVGVLIHDQQGNPVKPDIKDNKNGTYTVSYTPTRPLKHNVAVTWGEVSIPESPFKINIGGGLSKVKVYGPGVEPNKVKSKQPTQFTVDCQEAGKAPVAVNVKSVPGVNGPREKEIPCKVQDNGNNTFTVNYAPEAPGDYNVGVKFGGKEVPQSPIPVRVIPNVDVSKIKVKDLEPTVVLGKPFTVEVDISEAGIPELAVDLKKPSGEEVEAEVTPVNETCTQVTFVPEEEGPHELKMTCGGFDVNQEAVVIINVVVKTDPSQCSASGPGLTRGHVNKPSEFMIDVSDAGHGGLSVTVEGPSETEIECSDNGDGTCAVFYVPSRIGSYNVNVLFADQHIPGSPFNALVIDSTEVDSWGPGLVKGYADLPCTFSVDCSTAGKAPEEEGKLPVECSVVGPDGEDLDTKVERDPLNEDLYHLTYYPLQEGSHTLHVTYGRYSIPNFSRRADIRKPIDLSGVTLKGTGLDDDKVVFCDCPAEFQVDAKPVNQPLDKDLLKPDITAPSGQKVKPVIKDNKDNTYDVSYTPTEKGEHTVDVSFAGQPLGKSPYTVGALPGHDASRCKAYGPGLERAVTNKPAVFTVETKGAGKGGLGLAIEGPSEAAMECTDNKDGSCTVQYLPTVPGDYEVHITFADDPIPGSPFRPVVTDHIDASKVTASGPGLDRNGVRANVPTGFKVDATKAGGKAPLDVTIMPERAPIEKAKVVDNKDGTYDVSYVPKSEGKMQVDVTYGGRQIPQSPIHSKVLPQYDASKVKVKGPGVEKGVLASLPVEFTVDTRDAGDADLEITITDSSGKPITPEVTDNNDGTFKIIYTPKDVDSYTIKVKYGGEPVPKSPWTVSTKPTGDASKCDIIGETITKTVVVEEETVIKVNSRDAGKGHVTCTIVGPDGQEVPDCHVVDNGDGTFDIIWTCPAPGTYNVDIKFGGVSLTGGPITISAAEGPPEDLIDAETVMPSECRPLELQLPVLGAGHGNINDENGQPNGEPIKEVIEKDQIKPKETEPASPSSAKGFFYRVTEPIRRLGDRFGDKGEKSKAANEDWDFVHDLPSGVEKVDENGTPVENGEPIVEEVVGKEEVKPVEAGINFGAFMDMPEGQEPQAAPVDEEITKDKVDDVESGPPSSPGSGLKDLLKKPFTWLGNQFGDKPEEESKVSPLGTPNDRSFSVEVPEDFDRTGELNGEVKRPSGKKDIPTITENKDGHITVKYAPQETGKHELTIKYGTSHVPGSPFEFHVDELKSGQATAYGTGLTHGICGEQAVFTVNTKDAGPGGLALAVEGPSKAEIKCVDNKDGTCQVTYFPQKVGQYEVTVKFADKHVPGSPFKANIVDKAGSMMSIGSASDVPLKITETDLSQLKASITPPSGVEEPCALKRLPNGNIGITFTPKEVGEHLVNVKKYNRPIAGSPFKIIVGSQEVGDASKVKVKGRGISEADAGQMAEFVVDTRDAGYGGLGVSIEGPSKTEINCSDLGDGTCAVTYRPAEPGNYKLNVRFAEQDVPGSPFNVKVYPEDGSALEPLIQETMVKPTNAAPVQHAGSECELGLKIPGTDPLDMTAQVSNPRGQTEDAEIVDCPDCRYIVRFVPSMDGVHTVSVKNRGIHVPGSPFQFTVGPFGEGGAHKVHAGGPGLEGGEIGVPAEFTVWTREAGPGKLGISVKGPAKAEINIQDNKDGSYQVSYVPTAPGEYVIDIMYNDKPIPDSPFKPMITPALGEARRLSVSALHESGLKPNQPVSFAVQLNGAKGDLKAKVVAPSGCENECTITEIDNENYAVRFLPSENGVHLIHVYFKGHPIPGSPFKVRVGGHDMIGDPGMVHAYGDGLEKGKTGEPAEFIVNTCGAGAGSLSITIDAPSKVKLDVQEIGEGYKCIYYPTQPGDHLISIKYAGPHHIGGSPFKAKITGKAKGPTSLKVEQANVTVETVVKTSQSSSLPIFSSDASKCTSTGVGLKKAFINKKSQFTVNCSEAGHNMLLVGIAGPKTPCEEIVVKHMGRQRFSITYLLKETGDYKLVIKWGDDHIPGSPFLLHCS
ncbi:filamin-A-like isoform X2 [Acanthaster planci]|uniref:Filamin-A-like isoform X2 n=1 Tax=Acanthaster planci TaxID=133434 RepID=A0A8B7ZDE2_ACAPL|nr:filamin-A-like isoform X2 [Acanthaster planci]